MAEEKKIDRHAERSRGTWAGVRRAARAPGSLDAARDDGCYKPIADYAVIGDTRSCALISRDGSIDWLCWPRFDSRSVFARILDSDPGGFFSIRPSVPFRASRRYIESTNVLETTFTTDRGVVRMLDLMPVMKEEEKRHQLTPFRQLLRRVEGLEGNVPMTAVFDPRPDYARCTPKLECHGDTTTATHGPAVFNLRSDVRFDGNTANFDMPALTKHDFAL